MLDRNGHQSNTLQYTIDLGKYGQTYCDLNINPCLVHGCAYTVAHVPGVFIIVMWQRQLQDQALAAELSFKNCLFKNV